MDPSELASQVAALALEHDDIEEERVFASSRPLSLPPSPLKADLLATPPHASFVLFAPSTTTSALSSSGLPVIPIAVEAIGSVDFVAEDTPVGQPTAAAARTAPLPPAFTIAATEEQLVEDRKLLGFTASGFPVRKGVPVCYNWRKERMCPMGRNCKFSHPENYGTARRGEDETATSSATIAAAPVARASSTSVELAKAKAVSEKKVEKTVGAQPVTEAQGVRALHAWLGEREVHLAGMLSEFLKKHPQYTEALSKEKSKRLLEKYPHLFSLRVGAVPEQIYAKAKTQADPQPSSSSAVEAPVPKVKTRPVAGTSATANSAQPQAQPQGAPVATKQEMMGDKVDPKAPKYVKAAFWRSKGKFDDAGVKIFADYIRKLPGQQISPPDISKCRGERSAARGACGCNRQTP